MCDNKITVRTLDLNCEFHIIVAKLNLNVEEHFGITEISLEGRNTMVDNKMIHEFAILWFSKFRDKKSTGCDLAGDSALADACFSFDFKMDCGESFIAAYSQNSFTDFRELDKIIDSVDDISLLGSAIFSKWRYFNHWAYDPYEISEADNRAWFIIALSRLEQLTATT